MRGSQAWRERTENGLLGASACLLLGMVAHVAAGGRLPGPVALIGLLAVLTAVAVPLFHARIRRRFELVVSVLAALQFTLHLALDRLSGPGHGTAGPAVHQHTSAAPAYLCTHDGLAVVPDDLDIGFGPGMLPAPADGGADTHAAAGMPAGMGLLMTLTHALATFGTALLLVHGDRILRRLAALVVRRLVLPVLRCPAPRWPAPPVVSAPVPRLRGVLLARCVPRRGPPAVAWA
ncbi:hypothetical protein ACGFX4_10435 [Kitasatospora sp. NPDC048365]|uniref:hypothetical protein n=1 Tax=Kitasatospora sp. NPDC048365 TaxID=3364050 RepID=UPI00370FBE4B